MEGRAIPKRGRILSFKYALEGLGAAFIEEPNLKIHVFVALLITLAGIYFQISKTDWLILILTIITVVTLELTNAAIEAVVDGLTKEYHPSAKLAKDISAGAVLVGAVGAVAIGVIIFLPYVLTYL